MEMWHWQLYVGIWMFGFPLLFGCVAAVLLVVALVRP